MALEINRILLEFFSSLGLNNTPREYLVALGIFAAIIIALKLFGIYLLNTLDRITRKTKTNIDDMAVSFTKRIGWPFYVYIAFYISAKTLSLPAYLDKGFYYILVLLIGYYIVVGLNKSIDLLAKKEMDMRQKLKQNKSSMIQVIATISKAFVWIIAILMVLSNLGIEITPLIASLGIGGIAIALALQSVLGDLFGAFSIFYDKPFEEGDFIVIGDDFGTVEHIGIKTTRVRTLQGEELVISNSEMTSSRVHNYKKMQKRRIAFKFGVEYGTDTLKLKRINQLIKDIFKKIELADLDRVHFKEFGDFSLIYEVVYYLKTGDYNKYMDTQQDINFAIKTAFEKEKISMAFPTQTVHIKKGNL
ncbi:MAG: mechanosensitive ion channel family protein [Nanoarchaeota archaeon]|nr:mechanosensitive ion channel family protein [Nanoarchaeota archaeon]